MHVLCENWKNGGLKRMGLDADIKLKNTVIVEKITLSEFLISHRNNKWSNGP
jgi:hypothetical protein